ncbi:MAG: hypothetical protein ILA30_00945 [Selenomonas sp.]|nr:hypothetical protein [Selenomonas sp.]
MKLLWLRRRWKRVLLSTVLVIFLIAFLVLEVFSRGAAGIFNQAMNEQDMLRGTIMAEKIVAHINGHVNFTNLKWYDNDGRLLLLVPDGSFKARPWDVITGNIKSTTLQELTIKNAEVSIHLDDDMSVDFIRQSPEMHKVKEHDEDWQMKVSLAGKSEEERKRIGEFRRRKRAEKMASDWSNFDREEKKIRMKLQFEDCRLEVFFKERHYLLSRVNLTADINTDDEMKLNLNTGAFGGTMIGNGVKLRGTVDFNGTDVPEGDLRLVFMEVDPSSLDMGINIHDRMTFESRLRGPLNNFDGDGRVTMKDLHIPGLSFKNVMGRLDYDGEKLYFSDVEADVYGGHLKADGVYDLDTRYYCIHGKGRNLQASKALPGSSLSCPVDLDINLYSKGSGRETTTNGSFTSGEGRYSIIPFKRISGRFDQSYRDLKFHDVIIEFAGFTVHTEGLRIKNNKLTLAPIKLRDIDGNSLATIDPYE